MSCAFITGTSSKSQWVAFSSRSKQYRPVTYSLVAAGAVRPGRRSRPTVAKQRAGYNLFGCRRGLIHQDRVAMDALVLPHASATSALPPASLPRRLSLVRRVTEHQSRAALGMRTRV